MPSFGHVSYNSARIQRAYRINNIENMKLQNNIALLEKERMHRNRLTNQDIRLISLTLDYIQTSSGHSQEGLAPDNEPREEVEKEQGPCFLYGERIVSRKKRRNIRPQSAMDKVSSRTASETASTVSGSDITPRPQSSPVRQRPTFVTQIREEEPPQNGCGYESSRSGASTPIPRFKPGWLEAPPSDVTKILLNSSESSSPKRRNSVFEATTKEEKTGALKSLTRNLRIRSKSVTSTIQNIKASDDRPFHSGRGTRITDLLNKNKSAMSASEWKTHLGRAQSAGPVTSSLQRKSILESKKAMNNAKAGVIQTKINKFLTEES